MPSVFPSVTDYICISCSASKQTYSCSFYTVVFEISQEKYLQIKKYGCCLLCLLIWLLVCLVSSRGFVSVGKSCWRGILSVSGAGSVSLCPCFLRDSCAGCGILGTETLLPHLLLSCMVSGEESAVDLKKNPSYLASHFPPGVFKIFSLFTVHCEQFMIRLSVNHFEFIQVGNF